MINDDRILLVLPDGADAFDVKDFLVQQERCKEVTIDNRPYYGKGATVREYIKSKKSFNVNHVFPVLSRFHCKVYELIEEIYQYD